MISYYSIPDQNLSKKSFMNEDNLEKFIFLINRLLSSNLRVVTDKNNSTVKQIQDNYKYIKSLNIRNSIKVKIKYLTFRNKIRKSKFENIKSLNKALLKYKFYNGQIVFDQNDKIDTKDLVIEKTNEHIIEDQKVRNTRYSFNEIENDKLLVKAMLGSTYLYFGLFNFIDNIYYKDANHNPEDKKNRNFLNKNKKEIAESLNYFLKIFTLAHSPDNNFFFENKDSKKLFIYCSTKKKRVDMNDNYLLILSKELINFYKNELLEKQFINSFIESGGRISIHIFTKDDENFEENVDREDLHDRFIKTQNGLFSLSKDIDIYSYNFRDNTLSRKNTKFGYLDDLHAFNQKISGEDKNIRFQTKPFVINLH